MTNTPKSIFKIDAHLMAVDTLKLHFPANHFEINCGDTPNITASCRCVTNKPPPFSCFKNNVLDQLAVVK